MIEIKNRASIVTKDFTLNYANNPELEQRYKKETGQDLPAKNDEDIQRQTDDLSKYPVVYLNDVMIESQNISKLILYNDRFVPKLTIEFSDPTNNLLDDKFPSDNSIISVFKDSTNSSFMGIKIDFKVTDFTIIKGAKNNDQITYAIDGSLNVDELYINDYESYEGTSYDVIKKISTDIGLGFASNITNTNDKMIWINPSNYRKEFLRDIVDASYISDDTYLFGYIDFYYNFNYIDIEKQMTDDISEQKNLIENSQLIKNDQETETSLILTNHPDKDSTNLKIDKYTIENSSTNINLTYGYRHNIEYYNKSNDEIKSYNIDSISDEGDNKIVMKGNDTENDFLYNNMVVNTWMGKLDMDNSHENYLHSMLQNKMNLKFLQKLKMKVRMNRINYGLYRFQKVQVELYNLGKWNAEKTKDPNAKSSIEKNNTNQQEPDTFKENIIHKLSGEWLITAINIIYDRKEGNIQEITLVKRELTEKYDFPGRK